MFLFIGLFCAGAGYSPRHTNVFSSIGNDVRSQREAHDPYYSSLGGVGNSSTVKQAMRNMHSTADSVYDSRSVDEIEDKKQLLRADWGIKQWIPFLVGKAAARVIFE